MQDERSPIDSTSSSSVASASDPQAVADHTKAVLNQVNGTEDGDTRYTLLNSLANTYFDSGLVIESMRVREMIVDDSHIAPGRRSLVASALAVQYANMDNASRSQSLVDKAKDLANQATPAELETLDHEPSYAYLSAEAEIDRRDLNEHDLALTKVRECVELASKNLDDPSLSERRHRAAANQLLDTSDYLVRLEVQNNRRTEALNFVNGISWDIDHRPSLKPSAEPRARVEYARAIALSSNDDYDAALVAIDRALKGFKDAGMSTYALSYTGALRIRLMIGLATSWAAGNYRADADVYEYAGTVSPVAARSDGTDERASLILAARGDFATAQARISKAMQSNLRRQGPQSPYYKYESAMMTLYRLEDPTTQLNEGDIAHYVLPLVGNNDDWNDSSTRGAYVEDGALAMCIKRLMDDGPEGQALAFRIAELFHMNATQGAMSDGAARVAAATPELRKLIEQEQTLRREQNSDRAAFSKATVHLEHADPQRRIVRNRANEAVKDAEQALTGSSNQLHKLHDQIASQFPEYRELVSLTIPTARCMP